MRQQTNRDSAGNKPEQKEEKRLKNNRKRFGKYKKQV